MIRMIGRILLYNFLKVGFLLFFVLFFSLYTSNIVAKVYPQLRIIGSTTMQPFIACVSEYFNIFSIFPTPIVDSIGTGGGINLFCKGIEKYTPSIVSTSRIMTKSEKKFCSLNQVTPIEIIVGHNGIVISGSQKSKPLRLESNDLFRALSAYVIISNKLVLNPYQYWNEINSDLPKRSIKVLGPSVTSGIYDVFINLAIRPFCENNLVFKKYCGLIRSDWVYKAVSDHGNVVVQKLLIDSDAVGLFGYSFLDINKDLLWAASISNILPTLKSIANANYPLSHSFYLYLKKEHLKYIPGILLFIDLFLDHNMSGPFSVLEGNGLISLDPKTRFLQKFCLRQELK